MSKQLQLVFFHNNNLGKQRGIKRGFIAFLVAIGMDFVSTNNEKERENFKDEKSSEGIEIF